MILYRLYTERRDNLAELTARYFPGFTLLDGVGFWDNVHEETTIIEIIASDVVGHVVRLRELAETIRNTNNQHAVIITSHAIISETIGGDSVAW